MRADNMQAAQVKQELDAATEELQSARISPAVAAAQKQRPVPSSLLLQPPAMHAPAAAVGSQPGGNTSAACHEWATAGPASAGVQSPFMTAPAQSLAVQQSAQQSPRTGPSAEPAPVPTPATADRGLQGPSQQAEQEIIDLSDEACDKMEPFQPCVGGES